MMAFYHMCDEASSVITNVHATTMKDRGTQSTDSALCALPFLRWREARNRCCIINAWMDRYNEA